MTIRAYTVYECSTICAAVAAGAAIANFTTDTTLDQPAGLTVKSGLLRVQLTLTSAVASQIGLQTCSAVGTPTTTTYGTKVAAIGGGFAFGAVPNMSRIHTAWAVAPTLPGTTIFRRESLTAAAGTRDEFIWEWPEDAPFTNNMDRGIFADKGVALWNYGAGVTGAMVINWRWMEYNGAAIPQ